MLCAVAGLDTVRSDLGNRVLLDVDDFDVGLVEEVVVVLEKRQ